MFSLLVADVYKIFIRLFLGRGAKCPPEIDFAPPEKIVPPVAKKYYMHIANTMVKSLKQHSLHDLN